MILTVEELLKTEHPLKRYGYEFIFHTPSIGTVHATHVDIIAVWFGPFGDMNRDRRMPMVGEMYVDMHPLDAKKLGIEEGDYVWIDADPKDRPFHGWEHNPEAYEMARLMAGTLLSRHASRCYPHVAQRTRSDLWHGARCQGAGSRVWRNHQRPITRPCSATEAIKAAHAGLSSRRG